MFRRHRLCKGKKQTKKSFNGNDKLVQTYWGEMIASYNAL